MCPHDWIICNRMCGERLMKRETKKIKKRRPEKKVKIIKLPMKFNNALQKFEPDLDELEKLDK